MKTIQFKTNLKCNGCVAILQKAFENENSIKNWTVDLNHPDKLLSVSTDLLTSDEIQGLIKKAGFVADKIIK